MRIFSREISYGLLDYSELDPGEVQLFQSALRARRNAQTPYFKYCVGAAVMSRMGSIYSGCNVERATGSQTTHAEQNCIDTMMTWEKSGKIHKLVFVAAPPEEEIDITGAKVNHISQSVNIPVPCAHCLQIIWENCHGDYYVPIFSYFAQLGCVTKVTIGDALPFRFGPADLGVDYKKQP